MVRQYVDTLEELPFTAYMLLFGVGAFVVGVAIDTLGMEVNAGIVGAFGVVMIGLALVAHAAVWLLGTVD